MIKAVISYLKKIRKGIFLYLLSAAIFLSVFLLYDVDIDAVSYAFVLCGLILLIVICRDFFKYYRKYNIMKRAVKTIKIDVEFEDDAEDAVEEMYREMLQILHEEQWRLESDNRIHKKEMLDYYSLWVHQIKTPIAALRILLQAESELSFEKKAELETELFKIEQYVEMVLSYIRLEDMTSDLTLQYYSMDEIIKPTIRKYSKLFILKKIKLEYEPIDVKVLTDAKWLTLVMEQILSNALKYTQTGSISIYSLPEQEQTLVVEDTGIGICGEDLPRIFEKGFTGYNGRTNQKSTGIGLYLCKSIIDKLNHSISVESEIARGTKVYLNLARNDFQKE